MFHKRMSRFFLISIFNILYIVAANNSVINRSSEELRPVPVSREQRSQSGNNCFFWAKLY